MPKPIKIAPKASDKSGSSFQPKSTHSSIVIAQSNGSLSRTQEGYSPSENNITESFPNNISLNDNPAAFSGGRIRTASPSEFNSYLTPEDSKSISYWDQFLDLIQDMFNKKGLNADNIEQEVHSCPGQKQRGWIFNTNNGKLEIDFARCGCYVEALWPNLLVIPASFKAGAKMAARKLVRKARKRLNLAIFNRIGIAIKTLELDFYDALKFLKNESRLLRKLPPVPPGYVRLYRGQGDRRLQLRQRGQDFNIKSTQRSPDIVQFNDPNGHWWTSDPGLADNYAMVGQIDKGVVLPDYTPNSEVFYIDIPEADAILANLKNSPTLGLLPGQKRIADPTIKSYYDETLAEFIFPKDFKMPLRRRNPQTGIIEIVEDWPNSDIDLELNPGVFVWNDLDGSVEFYLDNPLNNTNFLSQVSTLNNLYKESKVVALAKLKERVRNLYNLYETLINYTESTDINKVARTIDDISSATNSLSNEVDSLFDKYDTEWTLGPLGKLKKFTVQSTYLRDLLSYSIAIIGFINAALQYVTVVENKKCGPKFYRYDIRQIGIGLTPGYKATSVIPKLSDNDWDAIRDTLIGDEARIFWAELDDNCECNSCPPGYNLCDSQINYFTDYYNTCEKCHSCSDDFNTIVLAENSKKPIYLSHKSVMDYAYSFEPIDCGCVCREPNFPYNIRYDKDDNIISSSRELKDWIGSPCQSFEDSNKKNNADKMSTINNKLNSQNAIYLGGFPFDTIRKNKICDFITPPDNLYENSIFPWLVSAYEWSSELGRWKCKKIKNCVAPQVFTEGVGDNNEYCDCVTINLSSSSSSNNLSSSSSSSNGYSRNLLDFNFVGCESEPDLIFSCDNITIDPPLQINEIYGLTLDNYSSCFKIAEYTNNGNEIAFTGQVNYNNGPNSCEDCFNNFLSSSSSS
jgi:hypothetical protein